LLVSLMSNISKNRNDALKLKSPTLSQAVWGKATPIKSKPTRSINYEYSRLRPKIATGEKS
jgi:hypothetical protein